LQIIHDNKFSAIMANCRSVLVRWMVCRCSSGLVLVQYRVDLRKCSFPFPATGGPT
jgi:hypothetical protein